MTGDDDHSAQQPGAPQAPGARAAPEPAASARQSQDPLAPLIRPGRSLRWSWVWLVPLLALLVGLSLLASVWVRTGPVITISFPSGYGLEAGQTKLRYRDVAVGMVKDIRVADDRQRVLVDVQLNREGAQYLTREGAKFWVVRPQVSVAGVTGLDTLLSGVYLGVDAPTTPPEGEPVYYFKGLENPPEILSGQVGSRYLLHTGSVGSLSVGSRVYYRRIEVGRIVSIVMAPDGRSVDLQIFVRAPYDRYVTRNTRFWSDSGLDMSISPDGVQVHTSGLSAIINGGVAFAQADESSTYDGPIDTTPVAAGSSFTLFATRDAALADPDGPPVPIELRFDQSVRGLRVGAGVDFRGLTIGKVVDIDLEFDEQRKRFFARVRARIFPMRFSEAYRELVVSREGKMGNALLKPLVERGLRAQLRTASLLTGQQYVALDFFPEDERGKSVQLGGSDAMGYLIPTVPGDFDRLQRQVGNIVTKLDKVPIDGISNDLQVSLKALNQLLTHMDTRLTPQASQVLVSARRSLDQLGAVLGPDAPLVGSLQSTLRELDQAVQALRLLADSLQAHPETLLRGHAPDRLR